MAEALQLKSRLLREGDPWQVDISQFKIPLTVDEKRYQRDLLNFRRKYAMIEQAQQVAPEDMVTLTCVSENPRFCKQHITIRVGMGLFSKELESQITGWQVGQTGAVTVREQPVEVTVEAIRRERLPEVDDALAARCGDPYIRTAGDIYAYCRGKQFDDALEMPLDSAFPELMRQVVENSEFVLDPQEQRFSEDMTVHQFLTSALFQERDFDSFPEEELSQMFGCTKAELLANMRQAGAYTLQCALLGQAMLERAGKAPTEADYQAYLRRFTDTGAMTEAQAAEKHPVLAYLLEQVAGLFMDEMEELTLRRLKEDV